MKRILQGVLKYFLPLLCGIGLFWYVCKDLNFSKIVDILKNDVNYYWVLLSMVVAVFSHIARALRWRLQLRALDINPSMRVLVNAVFGTYAMNLLFPRLGEVWRCGYLAQREKVSFTKVLGSVVSDRLFDTFILLLITLAIFVMQVPLLNQFASENHFGESLVSLLSSPWLYVVLVVGSVACILFFKMNTQNRLVVRVKGMLRNVWIGVFSIVTMKGKFRFVFYTLFIWFCYFLQLYFCIFAFPYTAGLSVLSVLMLYVLGSLSMVLPVQGGIGPWHAAVMVGLSYYGLVGNEAFAFTVVAHESQILLMILMGIYAFISIAFDKNSPKGMKPMRVDIPEEELSK